MTAAPPGSDAPSWMRVALDEVVIEITARPGASRRGTAGVSAGRLVIGVNSRAEKNKANEELIAYLAKELRLPQSAVMVVAGTTGRRKTIRIITHEPAKASARLKQISKPKA